MALLPTMLTADSKSHGMYCWPNHRTSPQTSFPPRRRNYAHQTATQTLAHVLPCHLQLACDCLRAGSGGCDLSPKRAQSLTSRLFPVCSEAQGLQTYIALPRYRLCSFEGVPNGCLLWPRLRSAKQMRNQLSKFTQYPLQTTILSPMTPDSWPADRFLAC